MYTRDARVAACSDMRTPISVVVPSASLCVTTLRKCEDSNEGVFRKEFLREGRSHSPQLGSGVVISLFDPSMRAGGGVAPLRAPSRL